MALTETERRTRSQIAAHTSWANTEDRSSRTAPARRALDARFLEQADGDPIRAESLKKAHFLRLALKSAQTRRRRAEALRNEREAELAQRISDLESGDAA